MTVSHVPVLKPSLHTLSEIGRVSPAAMLAEENIKLDVKFAPPLRSNVTVCPVPSLQLQVWNARCVFVALPNKVIDSSGWRRQWRGSQVTTAGWVARTSTLIVRLTHVPALYPWLHARSSSGTVSVWTHVEGVKSNDERYAATPVVLYCRSWMAPDGSVHFQKW